MSNFLCRRGCSANTQLIGALAHAAESVTVLFCWQYLMDGKFRKKRLSALSVLFRFLSSLKDSVCCCCYSAEQVNTYANYSTAANSPIQGLRAVRSLSSPVVTNHFYFCRPLFTTSTVVEPFLKWDGRTITININMINGLEM